MTSEPITLGDLSRHLGAQLSDQRAADLVIGGVAQSSQLVEPGGLYVALPGARHHGIDFLDQVVAAGAAAVLTDPSGRERQLASGLEIPVLVAHDPRAVAGEAAARILGTDPAAPRLAGITGTNGKTSTAFILDALLRALDVRTGLIGTIATRIGDAEVPSVRTTPEASELHGLMKRMREAGVEACSMEVSSHALSLHRADGLRFTAVGFTNLSQDHLDFHPTMEDYFLAKASLFSPERADAGVVVVDDAWGRRLAEEARIPVQTLSTTGQEADWRVEPDQHDPQAFVLHGPGTALAARSPLPGDFNRSNTALAILLAHGLGHAMEAIAAVSGRLEVRVPGRMDIAVESPRIVVDYSHTPEAVAQALRALDGDALPLVVVLGAGGDRDAGKRPAMGRAAALGADVVIITDDNPRHEDPGEIRRAVLEGARGVERARARQIVEIADRAEAIAEALRRAGTEGTVLLAGKGHEQGQEFADHTAPFDDREQARLAAERLHDPSQLSR